MGLMNQTRRITRNVTEDEACDILDEQIAALWDNRKPNTSSWKMPILPDSLPPPQPQEPDFHTKMKRRRHRDKLPMEEHKYGRDRHVDRTDYYHERYMANREARIAYFRERYKQVKAGTWDPKARKKGEAS